MFTRFAVWWLHARCSWVAMRKASSGQGPGETRKLRLCCRKCGSDESCTPLSEKGLLPECYWHCGMREFTKTAYLPRSFVWIWHHSRTKKNNEKRNEYKHFFERYQRFGSRAGIVFTRYVPTRLKYSRCALRNSVCTFVYACRGLGHRCWSCYQD